jgi:hypothetical protein
LDLEQEDDATPMPPRSWNETAVPLPTMALTTSWSGAFQATISPVASNGIRSRWAHRQRDQLAEFAEGMA